MFSTQTSPNWKRIAKDFEAILGEKGVIRRKEELLTYECDGLASYRQKPALVVLPRTTEEVAEAVALCDRLNLPWVARGAEPDSQEAHSQKPIVSSSSPP